MRWQAAPREALLLHELEGELAVRNALTGNTHLLGPLAAELLHHLLESEGLTSEELAQRVGLEAGQAAELDELLSDFKRLGLAAPAG